jgi:transposase
LHASEQQRPDVQLRRADWCATRSRLPAEKLVFIDETSLKTNLIRMYGRARRGQRVVDYAPHGHWKTTTLVSALRSHELTAPMVIDGALDGSLFLAYVGQVLLPTLQPGDVVVLDNLSSHKSKSVQELIESAGASVAYLPPYSPDLNPIEQAFSKLKWLLRTAAERTAEGLWNRVGQLFNAFSPQECLRYLHHCGYTSTLA